MKTLRFDRDRVVAEMDAIVAWLRTNGVTPEYVPIDATVVIDRRRLTVDTYVDLDGKPGPARLVNGRVRVGTVTVPLVEEPAFASLKPVEPSGGTS